MRVAFYFVIALMTACDAPEHSQNAATMDAIEQQVRMPHGALPLSRHSRFYTEFNNEVVGTYVASAYDDLAVGQRRWVKDIYHLPGVDDGGCFIVNIRFDPRARKVTQVFCNGIA